MTTFHGQCVGHKFYLPVLYEYMSVMISNKYPMELFIMHKSCWSIESNFICILWFLRLKDDF